MPPLLSGLPPDGRIVTPEGSMVGWAQGRLREATEMALAAIARDVQAGLCETVGVRAEWFTGDDPEGRASVVITLPEGTNARRIALAIDLENVEAWCDEEGRVHVAIGPWYTTKDTDQVVLSVTKVTHVLLGLHAAAHGEGHAHPHGGAPAHQTNRNPGKAYICRRGVRWRPPKSD